MGNQLKIRQQKNNSSALSGQNSKCEKTSGIPDLFRLIKYPGITEIIRLLFDKLIESEKRFIQQQEITKKLQQQIISLKKKIKMEESQTLRGNETTLRVIR